MTPIPLTLYVRPGCHLCEDMAAALDELKAAWGFDFRIVDVDRDPALAARYGHLVPVLTQGADEICHYFLDPEALRQRLAAAREKRSE